MRHAYVACECILTGVRNNLHILTDTVANGDVVAETSIFATKY